MEEEKLVELIELENKVREGVKDRTWLCNICSKSNAEKREIEDKCNIDFASQIILEAYCGKTYFYVNNQLRRTDEKNNEFVTLFTQRLNEILENIEPHNNNISWRWHVLKDEFNFLSKNIGKCIKFPDFKSTSLKEKEGKRFKILTSSNSNGKKIFKHIDFKKAELEKEVLFKTNSCFKIINKDKDVICLEEINEVEFNPKIDILASAYFWTN